MGEVSMYNEDIKKVCQTNIPWDKLSGCNILITGATGLIAGCLVEVLMTNPNRDYQIYASGRNEDRARKRFKDFTDEKGFHFLKYDVQEPLISEVNFDFIIHAASNGSPNFFANKPVEVMKSNLLGVINLMDYGLSHGMKRMLYVSSGEVYGEGDGREFTEDCSGYVDCLKPRSCYPSSKRAAETLCVSYEEEYKADVVIARPCHVYGPYFTEQDNRVYAQFIRNVLRGEDIIMKSVGAQYRSWCYVVDCVSALLHVLLKGGRGQAYNIADDSSRITIKELAEMIADLVGKKVVLDLPKGDNNKDGCVFSRSVFDTTKIKELGWNVTRNMRDKMKDTINKQIEISSL